MGDRCRSCAAPIIWARSTTTGALMPLDAEPHEDGNCELVDAGVIVHGADRPMFAGPLHLTHFVTCPDADAWRHQRALSEQEHNR